ncbi:MAG: excinuclease ABC subunit A [Bacteroidetes bacterium RIFCSPLOWO2_02_FULL_36_8]|nr:MAG: excinuclease ABC subunit A [Bacteroidetes bacterium RIFCSPLOWO2_02_FULL_36_8]OFY68945.1 MAG: excinuclease ABC subunit A [Bacteroidetes bacterium RIFCSPLOWO2_12_FULL_37_12]
MTEALEITGARVHNLRNIDVSFPRNKLVVITGISGSGKSSLAFDTIYAEGQRRYLETFSSYARQFLGVLERPDVDKIDGLSPVIAIEQKTTSHNPRSTVGTITEIYDYLRVLFANVSTAYSYESGKKMEKQSVEQIVSLICNRYKNQNIFLLSPLIKGRKGHYRELFENMQKQGYLRIRIDGKLTEMRHSMQLDRFKTHDIELVIDQLKPDNSTMERLSDSVKTSLKMGKGTLMVIGEDSSHKKNSSALDPNDTTISFYSQNLMCPDSGIAYNDPAPNSFSFNSPYGACPVCAGMGTLSVISENLLIPDATKNIMEGGISALQPENNSILFREILTLYEKHRIKPDIPFESIPVSLKKTILYGEETEISGKSQRDKSFEGIIPFMTRHYKENTESFKNWVSSYMLETPCKECHGQRLKKESLFFRIGANNIHDISSMEFYRLNDWIKQIPQMLNKKQLLIAGEIIKELEKRVNLLLYLGLDYLTLSRPTHSLSGGESQRIRLATQIGSQLTGVMYILDEPSIGLHQRDNQRLIESLKSLRDIGNSVVVVEHDKQMMREADFILDMGPGAGKHGGLVVAAEPPEKFIKNGSVTAAYLNGILRIPVPPVRKKGNGKKIILNGITGNNLKNLNVEFPLGCFICVTGVSGSGKSTLISETLYPVLKNHCFRSREKAHSFSMTEGLTNIDKVIEVDQSPIGRTPRSNPATYTGMFIEIRNLFSQLPESKIRGYKPGRFSFNVKGGRCDGCEGGGMKLIEMNFLPDVHVFCDTCKGKRYNRETLEIRYKGKSIADVLEMTVEEAVPFFENLPSIYRKIKMLYEVGLGYITLGQQATTLSGGEAQRVKLATELAKTDTGNTFYILDEPTTGLHFQDIKILLNVLNRLVEKGNSVLVIEHNMDVIKVADYIIDMGPEGGEKGGQIVALGTPEEIVRVKKSFTGEFLREEIYG